MSTQAALQKSNVSLTAIETKYLYQNVSSDIMYKDKVEYKNIAMKGEKKSD